MLVALGFIFGVIGLGIMLLMQKDRKLVLSGAAQHCQPLSASKLEERSERDEKDRKKDKKVRWCSKYICKFPPRTNSVHHGARLQRKRRSCASLRCLEAVSLVVSPVVGLVCLLNRSMQPDGQRQLSGRWA